MRTLFRTIARMFAPNLAMAVGEWITDSHTGCKVWAPYSDPNPSVQWTGPSANGVAHGTGCLLWFVNGELQGRYEGELCEGKLNGRGVFTYTMGTRYEGEWRNSMKHGYGIFVFENGDRYEGAWEWERPHGLGTFTIIGGPVLTGRWFNGRFKTRHPFGPDLHALRAKYSRRVLIEKDAR